MKVHKITSKKTKAQAMVEFAIVLPILLLLLYGLLEAGRLLFIYSTIVTASRQAVRYGSATGLGVGVAVPRYQDCQGIRASANRVDFLNSFDHTGSDVVIQWDDGPSDPNPPRNICAPGVASDPSYSPTNNNTRLLVTIDGDYLPIVPKIVPFLERSVPGGDPIHATSARTVLVSVAIQVTIPPSTFNPNTPTATNTKTPTPTPTPTNTPTFTPSPTPEFTATFTQTPTNTATPTITSTPTPTYTPTSIYTAAPCSAVTHGPIVLPDKKSPATTMSMIITNPYSYSLTIGSVYVVWNNDSGHQTGGDKTLTLTSVTVAGATFWIPVPPSPGISSPSTTISASPGFSGLIPPGTSAIVFSFHQTYDNQDDSEEILINLSTNGCQAYPIHETITP